ncbi:MAG: hypothetical protein KBC00_01620 [Candidatus Levybacteria bacterium]|nr:hypothetical protein [Candidatus Levybacteria bacterium]MBP9814825.1 hypothetical protein [Candidatus Levybacteria bacterium]
MIDTVQLVLLFVIVLLAVLFVILGIQVFLILRELRTTLVKTNKILDDVDSLTESVSEPLSFISGLLFSSKTFATIASFMRRSKEKHE